MDLDLKGGRVPGQWSGQGCPPETPGQKAFWGGREIVTNVTPECDINQFSPRFQLVITELNTDQSGPVRDITNAR
jgi:hypothetical protein